jgi:hypothetical protein
LEYDVKLVDIKTEAEYTADMEKKPKNEMKNYCTEVLP